MEIAFFTESYLPMRDGVAAETSALARALTRRGHSVSVYTVDPGVPVPPPNEEDRGIEVHRVSSVPVLLYPQYRWAVFPFPRLHWAGAGKEADVVHLHTPGIMGTAGLFAGRRFHRPVIGTFHTNVWAMRDSFPPSWPVRLFFRAALWYTLGTYWRCDLATAPTGEARLALEQHAAKPWRRPIEVVPNGIEVERFHPGIRVPDWRERCGLPEVPLATYLGRLTLDKGVHRFLDAAAAVDPSVPFAAIVAGSGPEEATVRERIRSEPRLARRVRYIGPVAEAEKASLLAQTDVFVLPSTSDTASVALLEAMASGATCLASDVGGPSEIVRDGANGRLVPVADPLRLPAALEELLIDPDERRRLSEGALTFVRASASIERTAERFEGLYRRVLAGGRAA